MFQYDFEIITSLATHTHTLTLPDTERCWEQQQKLQMSGLHIATVMRRS